MLRGDGGCLLSKAASSGVEVHQTPRPAGFATRAPIHRARALTVALASLSLIAGAALTATPARAAEDLVSVSDLATGQRPTSVLAASGSYLVARARETATAGVTRWSADGGTTWQAWPDGFTPSGTAAYVADGKAVWNDLTDSGDRYVRVVDLTALPDPSAIQSHEVSLAPRAVTDTEFVLGESGAAPRLVQLDGSAPPVALQLDGTAAPSKATHPAAGWVLRPAGLLYTTAWSAKAGGRSSYTDIDPVGATGGFGLKPFRVSGYVPYVNLVWKTTGADGLALIEYLQLSGTKLNFCTREWNTATDTLKAASCRRVTTTSKSATISATRHGAVLAITLNGALRLWRSNKLVKVRTVSGHTTTFTGVGDAAVPLVRADRGVGGAIYRTTVSNGALTKAFDYFTARVSPSVLDLGLTRLAGLDGRARQQGWTREVDDSGIDPAAGAVDLAGATLGLQVSGSRQVQRTAKALVFSDSGTPTATAAAVTALTDTSGPYTLVTRKKETLVLGPTGSVVAKPSRKGNTIVALYGSVVVEQNSSRTSILIRELTGKPGYPVSVPVPGAPDWKINRVLVHGDNVVVGMSFGSFRSAYAFNRISREWTEAQDATPVAVGDGVAALYDLTRSAYALWQLEYDFDSMRPGAKVIEDADTSVAPSFDGVDRLVYSTGTALKLIDLSSWDGEDLSGRTGPRVLGTVAPTSYEINAPGGWKLALDLSRPVGEGRVEIRQATGARELVRTLDVPASSDGAIRVAWDGLTDPVDPDAEGPEPAAAMLAPDGSYTWRYLVDDTADPVLPINGDATATPGGSIRVHTAAIKSARPTISGSLAVGKTVTAKHSWTPSGLAYAYQWYASGVAIPGATERSYTLTPAERGKKLTVRVTATHRRGPTATKTSKASKAVGYGTLATKAPTLSSSSVRVGEPVSVNPGTWTPTATFSYAWYRVNSKGKATLIKGATKDSYTPVAADRGNRLRVKVTGKATGYKTASRTSSNSGKVASGVLVTSPPTLPAQAPVVGTPIEPVYTPWGPGTVTLGYAWYRMDGSKKTAIRGATGPTYTPVAADLGTVLRLEVRGTRSGFTTVVVAVSTDPVEAS